MSVSRKNRIKDLATLWVYGICIILIFWMISSTFEVWYHNALAYQGKDYEYSILNFYQIMLEYVWR